MSSPFVELLRLGRFGLHRTIGSTANATTDTLGDDEEAGTVLPNLLLLTLRGKILTLGVVAHILRNAVGEALIVLRLSIQTPKSEVAKSGHIDARTLVLIEHRTNRRSDRSELGLRLRDVLKHRAAELLHRLLFINNPILANEEIRNLTHIFIPSV